MPNLITAEAIATSYRPLWRAETKALDNFSISLNSSEIVGLFGLNGAGKTTAIRVLLGLMRADKGKINVMGLNPLSSRNKILTSVGVILNGERYLKPRLKADDILLATGVSYNLKAKEIKERSNILFEKLGLEEHRHKFITEYSRGMRQKLSLILALLHRPKLLILDEPIVALDVETTQELLKLLREIAHGGCGVLISSHQINTISSVIDKAVIIKDGVTVFEGNKNELLRITGNGKIKIELRGDYVVDTNNLPSGVEYQSALFLVDKNITNIAEFFVWARAKGFELYGLEPIQDLESAFLTITGQKFKS